MRWTSTLLGFLSRNRPTSDPNTDSASCCYKEKQSRIIARLPSRYIVDVDPNISVAQTYGLIRFHVHGAYLEGAKSNREYFATVSIGKQAFCTASIKAGNSLDFEFNASADFVLQRGGATTARVALFRQGALEGAWNNAIEGYCEVDLAAYFTGTQCPASVIEGVFDLLDPEDSSSTSGSIRLSGQASSLETLERQVWEHLLALVDFDGSGTLNQEELGALLEAFGSNLTDFEIKEVFEEVDADANGYLDVTELAAVLSLHGSNFSRLVRRCPVDGAELSPNPEDQASNLLYVWLALCTAKTNHEADVLRGGFITETQAAGSWILRLTEWASHPLEPLTHKNKNKISSDARTNGAGTIRYSGGYVAGGLRVGSAAHHVLVYERSSGRIVEELINPVLNLAMRKLYQSKVGSALLRQGLSQRLKALSIKEGEYRSSPESAKAIAPFVNSYRGQINVDEAELRISEYETFNDFFVRKLKPGRAPSQEKSDDPDVVVSAADCRLQVYETADEATRFWIKGRNFSIAGLLGDTTKGRGMASACCGGSLAIFRLAPQDYHRFHSPVDGVIVSITDIPGDLLTFNPIAVNYLLCNVFTVNKRSVMWIETPNFERVAFVAIGATMVGSITWTATAGDRIRKGDELGFFAFGGSTCIAVFPPGTVLWDADVLANARRSLETLVKVGERIGARHGSAGCSTCAEREVVRLQNESVMQEAGIVALDERPATATLQSDSDAAPIPES